MASVVYFKFKSSVKTDSISFDGSSISVKDIKNAIKNKCCLHSTGLDLKLEDNSGKEYTKDGELIPKFTSIIVRRFPKPNADCHKRRPPHSVFSRDVKTAHPTESTHSNITNLADSNLPEDEKIRLMIDRSSEAFSAKNYVVKAKADGVPPAWYVCHKCNQSGHWIHVCPGIKDEQGNLVDSKTVKRPTGIPQDFLVNVNPGTPGAYLDKSGRYMVPIKDAEAYSQKKKEKRAFSVEENPPYVPPQQRTPSEGLVCPLCKNLLKEAVLITCCGMSYCNECISNHLFDAGSQQCPNCDSPVERYDSSIIENAAMRRAVMDWLKAGSSPELTKISSSPDVNQIKNGVPEPDKVVRRLLKPKQPTLPNTMKLAPTENGSSNVKNDETKPIDFNESKDAEKMETPTPECLIQKTVPFSSKSNSSVTHVKSLSIDSQSLPVISNTNSVASLPCATSFGAGSGTSVVPPFPVVTSLYNGTPLVFSDEGSSLASALYSANLAAGLTTVGAAKAPLASVFPSASLVSSSNIWHPDVPFLSGVDQGGLINPGGVLSSVNPLVDLHNAVGIDKLLSPEEFYRMKRQLMEKSSRGRIRRSRSRDSQRRSGGDSRRRIPHEYYSRRRDNERRLRRPSPPRRRLHSHSSESDHRLSNTGEGVVVEDYDTWRRRKERRQQFDPALGECRRRVSPFRKNHRSDSPTVSATRSFKREASPHRHRYAEEYDKSRLRSPFILRSPSVRSVETVSPPRGESSRTERNQRLEGSDFSQKNSSSRKLTKIPTDSSVQNSFDVVDSEKLDAKTLKRLRKEKKRAKRERKLAKQATRAQKAVEASSEGVVGKGIYDDLDGISSVLLGDDGEEDVEDVQAKRDRKKRKRKYRAEHQLDSDTGSHHRVRKGKKEKKARYLSAQQPIRKEITDEHPVGV